jgi:uncharacterized coiled-coil DUF342 family protein
VQSELKEKFLELLDKDKEFRYAVAGYLGLADILKRLDRFEETQTKILEEIKEIRIEQSKLWENQNKLWEEIKSLRENQERLMENQNKMWEEIRSLREDQKRLWENQNKMWEEIRNLREGQNQIWKEIKSLREDQNKMWEEIRSLREGQNKIWKEIKNIRLEMKAMREEQRRLSITVERLTISVEEEARDVISYRLNKELGIEIKLDRLFIKGREINIYGASGDICVIGEASVRLGPRIVNEVEKKIELIRKYKPELLRPKLIKVIYTDIVLPRVLELASENNIWVLNWKGDLLPMKIIQS